MKLTIKHDAFASAFLLASSVAPSRSPMEILKNVLITVDHDTVRLTGTNRDQSAIVHIDKADVSIDQTGTALLPVDRIGRIARDPAGDTIRLDLGTSLTVRSGQARYRISTADPAEFPGVGIDASDRSITLQGGSLHQALTKALAAIERKGSNRYSLGGVNLEMVAGVLSATGTDGRRLTTVDVSASGSTDTMDRPGVIVPEEGIGVILRAIKPLGSESVSLAVHAGALQVRAGSTMIQTRLLEGRYPAWRTLFPTKEDGTSWTQIPAGVLQTAVHRASVAVDEFSRGVICAFEQDQVTITGTTQDGDADSRIQVPIDLTGSPVTVRADYRFILDFCRTLGADDVVDISLQSHLHPILLACGDTYRGLIMPMSQE